MAEEITDEQIFQLEEKLKQLAQILTRRKIDWTHFYTNNSEIIELYSKQSHSSYFRFSVEKQEPNKNYAHIFTIKVETYKNIGGIFFYISKTGFDCKYWSDNGELSAFTLPNIIVKRVMISTLFNFDKLSNYLDREFLEQQKIVHLLSKLQ